MVNRKFLGLLCDLDGTLADSEPLHCTAWLELLAQEYNLDYDEHWFDQWIGTSDRVVAQYLVDEKDLSVTAQHLIDQKQTRFHDAVRKEGKLFPGVARVLEVIGNEFPLAIATNSGRADADLMISSTGLDGYTQISVTASDVKHMKPSPDIYLLAAERLDLSATDCIAIEDSGPGGQAALAAGCYLIGLTDRVTGAQDYADSNEAALEKALELLRQGRE